MPDETYHKPVMTEEISRYLVTDDNGVYVDCTLGGGGHAGYLLSGHANVRVIGFDWDAAAVAAAGRNLSPHDGRITIIRENFKDVKPVLSARGLLPVNGLFADLGVSSRQLDDISRGFSFASETLDMRMDTRGEQRAMDLVNSLDADTLADVIFQYGEERLSRPIARQIVREREKGRITSGVELARIVEQVKRRRGKIHPATLVFQALRIAVNRELDNLSALLGDLPEILAPGGRAVFLSYHSLEDRIIKNSFREQAGNGVYRLLTKKVVIPSEDEMKVNPRARSAKLRAVEKL